MEAVINMVISAFAIQRTWTYIRDPKNDKDLWWYMNAFIMALAVFSIFINGSTLRKVTAVPPPPPPPMIQAVPVVQVAPAPIQSVGDQARMATQKAVALTQQAHLQAP
jgi:hypothetical protein